MAEALKETNLTAVTVAQRVEERLRPALEPLGERSAVILLDSLDLAATPDRPEREVVGVEAEPSSISNEDQIRFEAPPYRQNLLHDSGLGFELRGSD